MHTIAAVSLAVPAFMAASVPHAVQGVQRTSSSVRAVADSSLSTGVAADLPKNTLANLVKK
jgi:hypothetical protein